MKVELPGSHLSIHVDEIVKRSVAEVRQGHLLRRDVADPECGPLSQVGVSICEDRWDEYDDVKPLTELVVQGAGLILNSTAKAWSTTGRGCFQPALSARCLMAHRDFLFSSCFKEGDVFSVRRNTALRRRDLLQAQKVILRRDAKDL